MTLSLSDHLDNKPEVLSASPAIGPEIIGKYFPTLTEKQSKQIALLFGLYQDWNTKINVISRKDIDHFYEHHVLHSLAIAKINPFEPGARILDVGTGGGFPGIPLAIAFPEAHFTLIDSIGKKIRVATEVAKAIGLDNVTLVHENVMFEKAKYDFVVSRAVMPAADMLKLVRKNFAPSRGREQGLLLLKGGDLSDEVAALPKRQPYQIMDLANCLDEPYFETKKLLYIPLN